ncbi:MAG TPA: 7-carboxy-7-deazaguanine synthase QueE [Parapedobacter sp.]|uniref:7-carboxy-7-deazaguanine synthase QueE n=1 Tax=Parapedobacter sp. TaxID=1958893 RepID=UPI002CCA0426|nr:7-carboxy-7-deazaguanine synthase QueE [Parapedobacter sp.]HWK56148.1 7-carboxy-7-deazaguanine synthase QueE [Parapedobacter sp.]
MAHQVPEDGTLLPLMEEFYTIQGEGYHTGKAAYFIRLGGCDVGCHWCDVKESWDAELHPLTSADAIVEHAKQHPSKAVVVTGGEPLLYNLDYLTSGLQAAGIQTFIETSGAYPLSGYWDWICLSPKKFKSPLPDVIAAAGELKVIVFNKSDFAWAEQHAALVSPKCKLYLQPEWSKAQEMTPLIVNYVMQNPKWEISLQTHKYLNIP